MSYRSLRKISPKRPAPASLYRQFKFSTSSRRKQPVSYARSDRPRYTNRRGEVTSLRYLSHRAAPFLCTHILRLKIRHRRRAKTKFFRSVAHSPATFPLFRPGLREDHLRVRQVRKQVDAPAGRQASAAGLTKGCRERTLKIEELSTGTPGAV